MPNSTAGANLSISHGGQGTRDADGNLTWNSPVSVRSLAMAGFSQFDVDNSISATVTAQDLSALNLDGSGAKDLTGLYGFIVLEYVSGTGYFTVDPGASNPYYVGTFSVGSPAAGAMPSAIIPITVGALVDASHKTLDLTLTGTCTIRETVYAGAISSFGG